MWAIGFGLFLIGLFFLAIGGILFFTIIFIPLAIIAAIIGLIMLIAGGLAAALRPSHAYHHNHHIEYNGASGEMKYCSRCGTPNPKENMYCAKCGKQFLE